jgi:MFS family permease
VLNAVWAASIVLCEVPSGALADIIGRKNLLVFSGALMVVEMAILAFAPRGNLDLLFVFFLINRVLSGMAEASASGADEALAYDALSREGDISDWGVVLEKQMRIRSLGFIITMITGAAVYDPRLMQAVADFLGLGFTFTKEVTLRLPIYLTLILALLAFASTVLMKEIRAEDCDFEGGGCSKPVREAFKLTFKAGRWILCTPFVLVVILAGLIFDSVSRMMITMASQYYRVIEIPEAMFGVIGSALAVSGLIIPSIARRLADKKTPVFNVSVMAVIAMSGLIGMSMAWPVWGIFPALFLFGNMYFNGFFLSFYLNRAAPSDQRATVLSFKGLSFNLAYGMVGIMYSLLLSFLRPVTSQQRPELTGEILKNAVFIDSMAWFPWYFGACLAALATFAVWKLKDGYQW